MKVKSQSFRFQWALLAGCLALAVGYSSGQTAQSPSHTPAPPNRARQADAGRAPGAQSAQPNPPSDDYVIGEEDILSISVWKEPDLTRQVPVRPDGKISLPLIGEVVASGLTAPKLSSVITEKLKAYISNPEVNVIVQEVRSQVFNVVGEVLKPGPYELTRPTTVLDAIGLAGGPAPFAKLKSIRIMRTLPDGKEERLYFDYKAALKGQKMEQNIYLKTGDIVIVP